VILAKKAITPCVRSIVMAQSPEVAVQAPDQPVKR
jgi:hypothetical protein